MNVNLKMVSRFGKFYEYENQLGWMPFYKVFLIILFGYYDTIQWVPYNQVIFEKKN